MQLPPAALATLEPPKSRAFVPSVLARRHLADLQGGVHTSSQTSPLGIQGHLPRNCQQQETGNWAPAPSSIPRAPGVPGDRLPPLAPTGQPLPTRPPGRASALQTGSAGSERLSDLIATHKAGRSPAHPGAWVSLSSLQARGRNRWDTQLPTLEGVRQLHAFPTPCPDLGPIPECWLGCMNFGKQCWEEIRVLF